MGVSYGFFVMVWVFFMDRDSSKVPGRENYVLLLMILSAGVSRVRPTTKTLF